MKDTKVSQYLTDRDKISFLFSQGNFKDNFESLALAIYEFQYRYNDTYHHFCHLINRKPDVSTRIEDIPFLPIQFFKTHAIKTGAWTEEVVFSSSGTTGQIRSKHFIKDLGHYLRNCVDGFVDFFSDPHEICFLAILPGYVDRQGSSLIYMVDELISYSKYKSSGFYLGRESNMLDVLATNKMKGVPTVLFGVSFALLELCKYEIDFDELVVIETGGMKNSKIDLTKDEILGQFKKSWTTKAIASEYGMTELLSQSYAIDSKWYKCCETKRVMIRSLSDPFALAATNKVGLIKVIDLANFDTCSFIETEDLGISDITGQFQVLGRMNNAELRGCNLLLDQT